MESRSVEGEKISTSVRLLKSTVGCYRKKHTYPEQDILPGNARSKQCLDRGIRCRERDIEVERAIIAQNAFHRDKDEAHVLMMARDQQSLDARN